MTTVPVANANLDIGGTDSTAALQALLDAGQPLPPGAYGISATLTANPAVGKDIGGAYGGRLGPDDITRGTWLIWQGPPGGTALELRGIKCRVHDLGFAAARFTSLDRCINVDAPSVYPGLSSQHTFENIAVDGRAGKIRCGWVVGESDSANDEFHWFCSCLTRCCTYAAVSVPNSTRQCKNWVFEDCTFSGSGAFTDYGVNFNSGSADFWRCNFNALGCGAAWFGAANEPCNFFDCTGETCQRYIQATGVKCLNLIGCRLNCAEALNPQPVGQEVISGANNLNIIGCEFEEPDNLLAFIRCGVCTVFGMQFHSTQPFPADDQTIGRYHFANVRFDAENNLYPDGPYYQRFVPNLVHGGLGIVFGDGKYPPNITYNGGTPTLGAGMAKLYFDSGKLWLSVAGAPPVQVLTQ